MIEQSGGRAGPNEFGFVEAGYKREEIEALRQQLLNQNDVGKVQKAIRKLGIRVKRGIIQAVKTYNFDSQGLGFTYENYAAWRRLVTGNGTVGDVAYIVHEIAEVTELQRIRRESGFDFMGLKYAQMTYTEARRWDVDFTRHYRASHSKALKKEYEFITKEVNRYINKPKLKLSTLQIAAIDPTRYISQRIKETQAAAYMFVDGVVMKKHHHYEAWRKRANDLIPLSKATQRRLGYYRSHITVLDLIRHIKNMPIG